MNPKTAAHAHAHHIAAELLREGVQPSDEECVAMAIVEDFGLCVRVAICKCENRHAVDSEQELRKVEQAALRAAPKHNQPPVSVKRLASLAGYAYTSYFRSAVQALVDMRRLTRDSRGVRRAS